MSGDEELSALNTNFRVLESKHDDFVKQIDHRLQRMGKTQDDEYQSLKKSIDAMSKALSTVNEKTVSEITKHMEKYYVTETRLLTTTIESEAKLKLYAESFVSLKVGNAVKNSSMIMTGFMACLIAAAWIYQNIIVAGHITG